MSTTKTSARDSALPRKVYDYYLAMGVAVHIHHDMARMEYVVSAVAEGGASISKRAPDDADVTLLQLMLRGCVNEVMTAGKKNQGDMRVQALESELAKYKSVVKQLSFDLEMQNTTPRAVATEADVRKQTLEMAAEFLMDYGIIKSGGELESVCNQMKKLHPSKTATINAALAKMNAAFGGKQ